MGSVVSDDEASGLTRLPSRFEDTDDRIELVPLRIEASLIPHERHEREALGEGTVDPDPGLQPYVLRDLAGRALVLVRIGLNVQPGVIDDRGLREEPEVRPQFD